MLVTLLKFLSGGYYNATIHRIVRPPVDQQAYNRLSLFYFCSADDDAKRVRAIFVTSLLRVAL
ncbi:hypothetical protein DFH07DRAFT_351394 [Mycena maculata]|uniref:Isopenicillin N synthase-like Fe(2+) 2OG dioxygenase domain-containing protein n=1 Tax=Mycena maculata TaxID=230809 RepID=A0AAD7JMD6_9AGAR|nr:hypothetical protein DFH07DRAFT_351394 [Mycena maculata]